MRVSRLMEMWNERVVGPILESWEREIQAEKEQRFCAALEGMLRLTEFLIPERQFEYSTFGANDTMQITCTEVESDMMPKKTRERDMASKEASS